MRFEAVGCRQAAGERTSPLRIGTWLQAVAVAILGLVLSGCGGSSADRDFGGALTIELGDEGRVQVGEWNPISIQAAKPPAKAVHPEVIAADPDGLPVRFLLPDFKDGVSRGRFLIGQISSPIRVEFVPSETPDAAPIHTVTLSERNSDLRFLKPDVRLWGIFEPDTGLRSAIDKFVEELRDAKGADASSPVEVRSVSPTQPGDFDGLDALFVGADTLRNLAYGAGQTGDALKSWLARGGQLVVIARGAPADYDAPAVKEWFPIQVDSQSAPIRFRDLVILSQGVNRGLLRTPREGTPGVRMTAPTGRVLATSLDGDLLMRAPYGQGSVTMLAINSDEPPLRDWDGLPALLAGQVDYDVKRETARQRTNLNPTGISDLQTQVLRTTNQFPEVSRPSYWSSLGLIVVAFLVIGPVDYFLVHHLLRRPHWTWFTLTAWVALLTFVGVSYANRTSGTVPLANQVEIVDIDETLHRVHARSWFTLYSPQSQRVDITVDPDKTWPVRDIRDREVRWSGRPEAGFRGMHRPGGLSSGEAGYTLREGSDGASMIEAFPLRAGSTCDIESSWSGTLDEAQVAGELEGDLKSRFQGQFKVNLPGPLTDWFIAYGRFAYHAPLERRAFGIMTLKPGTCVDIKDLQAKMLGDYLTGVISTSQFRKNRVDSDYVFTRETYDPTGIEPYDIFKMISFYRAAGGKNFVTLTNGPVMGLDRSGVVSNGHAVLFGRLEIPASQLTVKDAAPKLTAETFVRVVLPVRQIETDFSFPAPPK